MTARRRRSGSTGCSSGLRKASPGISRACAGDVIGLLHLGRSAQAGDGGELISFLSGFNDPDSLRNGAQRRLAAWIDGLREAKERGRSHVLQRALLYIGQRYKEELSMEQTAEHVNLSPYYFSKLFKLQTGENFSDYVTRLRIEEAKRLIAEGA